MTSDGLDDVAPPARTERSRLLPYNRRLRHLHGVTIRNLSLPQVTKRQRGYTFDDEVLPYTTRSPAKLKALEEEKRLTQTRSSGNLRDITAAPSGLNDENTPNGEVSTPRKPPRPRTRRQSTLDIASPSLRKQRYEAAVYGHLADAFCSIHVPETEAPVYVTEIAKDAMNPDFRFFDLTSCDSSVSRSDHAVFKLWAKQKSESQWQHLQDLHVDLRFLVLVARSVDGLQDAFPENTLLFHFSDGIYVCSDAAAPPTPLLPVPRLVGTSQVGISEPSSSYDALMRLQTLESCIDDAFNTRDKLINEINDLLKAESTRDQFRVPTELEVAKDNFTMASRAVDTAQRNIKIAQTSIKNLRDSISARRNAMRAGAESSERARSFLESASHSLAKCQTTHATTTEDIEGQRRRIVVELQEIFPIEPLAGIGDGNIFAIRGAALPPNSDFSNMNAYARPSEMEVSAALGYAAHLVKLLSLYLFIPLPYPITPRSSLSVIQDPISILSKGESRNFPLYAGKHAGASGAPLHRFEYAVYLLNKNIEILMHRSGTRTMDIRQTLANLGLLMFSVSGGGRPGEIPPRFRGAVRGLALHSAARRPTWSISGPKDDSSDVSVEVGDALIRRHSWTRAGGADSPRQLQDQVVGSE